MNNTNGFTIIEMAIAIVIMGLLLATVSGGFNLITSARLQRTCEELTSFDTQINLFRDSYDTLPGDLASASSQWGSYSAGPPISGAHNGDGDTMLNDSEDLYAWRHLQLADMIAGSYSGVVIDGSTRFGTNTNAPSTDINPRGLYQLHKIDTEIYNRRGHALQLGEPDSNGEPENGVIHAQDAWSIDKKIDDGIADSGKLFSKEETSETCLDVSDQYSLTATTDSCVLIYWIDIF
mgnify:CR=1 FL=1